jgi:uncharacterized protein (DUF2062 family)
MNIEQKKYSFFQKIGRAFKLNGIKLLRSPGGSKKVALGFALGMGIEMLVISTASLIYILFVPIVRISKGSLPAAIIGNVIGKLSFLPVILLPIAKRIGKIIYPMKIKSGNHSPFSVQHLLHGDFSSLVSIFQGGIHVLIGMTILGTVIGIISYFIVYYFYEKEKKKKLIKKRDKHVLAISMNKNLI